MLKRIFTTEFPFDRDQARKPVAERGLWPAQWIALPGVAGDGEAPYTALFELDFELDAPRRIRLFIAADTLYRFEIDGDFAAEGPEQGDAAHTYVDSFDWDAAPGRHRFRVLAVWFGKFAPWSRMAFRGGMLLAADGDAGTWLNTGVAGWRVARSGMFRWRAPFLWATPAGAEQIFDAAQTPDTAPPQFQEPEVLYPGATARYCNDLPPGPRLCPAALPDRRLDSLLDFEVRYAGPAAPGNRLPDSGGDPVETARWQTGLHRGGLRIASHERVRVLLELSDYGCVTPELTVSGGRGAEISLAWAETLFRTPSELGEKGDRREWRNGYFYGVRDSFLPDGREGMTFYTLRYRAGRFALLEIAAGSEPLTVASLRFRENRYPFAAESTFTASDPRLAPLNAACRRTLEMCMHDTFMDCPYYEQLMYVGDTRIQALLNYTLTRDDRLAERALRLFAASSLESGFVQSRYPSRRMQKIPTYTASYVGMVADYARWRGGTLPQELLSSALRGADAFERRLTRDGLAAPDDGWNFVDWAGWPDGAPPVGADGASGVVNAIWLHALAEAVELCAMLGEEALARHYRKRLAERTERFCAAFWDDEKGIFLNTREETQHCEHIQVLALLAGSLPADVAKRCFEALERDGFAIRSSCYFKHLLYEVFTRMGRGELVAARLGEFSDMLDAGLKTMRERPEPSRSDCHAWSAHPLYRMFTTVLGIRPAGYGFATVEIRPAPGALEAAHGRMVHPGGGVIEVALRGADAEVRLPAPLTGVFRTAACDRRLVPGVNLIPNFR